MNVTTGRGKDDGSNNNVNYKICSDVDDLCCQVNPDSVSKNEYSKGATDRKVATDFGDCAKYLFKVSKEFSQLLQLVSLRWPLHTVVNIVVAAFLLVYLSYGQPCC